MDEAQDCIMFCLDIIFLNKMNVFPLGVQFLALVLTLNLNQMLKYAPLILTQE